MYPSLHFPVELTPTGNIKAGVSRPPHGKWLFAKFSLKKFRSFFIFSKIEVFSISSKIEEVSQSPKNLQFKNDSFITAFE